MRSLGNLQVLSRGLICLHDTLWKRIHPLNCLWFCPEDGGTRKTAQAIIYFFTSIPFSSFPSPTPTPFLPHPGLSDHQSYPCPGNTEPPSLCHSKSLSKPDILEAEDSYGSAKVCLRTQAIATPLIEKLSP